jgi:hypothetical protein
VAAGGDFNSEIDFDQFNAYVDEEIYIPLRDDYLCKEESYLTGEFNSRTRNISRRILLMCSVQTTE